MNYLEKAKRHARPATMTTHEKLAKPMPAFAKRKLEEQLKESTVMELNIQSKSPPNAKRISKFFYEILMFELNETL